VGAGYTRDKNFFLTTNHTHESDNEKCQVELIKAGIKFRALNTSEKPKDNF
jgi:hypothetical protein